jgi:uncharacterized iron-regulated membrane protein
VRPSSAGWRSTHRWHRATPAPDREASSRCDWRDLHDLLGTAVTRLAFAGCTEAEIAIYTGLSLDDVRSILTKHYLNRDPAIAENAAAKLAKLAEARTKSSN